MRRRLARGFVEPSRAKTRSEQRGARTLVLGDMIGVSPPTFVVHLPRTPSSISFRGFVILGSLLGGFSAAWPVPNFGQHLRRGPERAGGPGLRVLDTLSMDGPGFKGGNSPSPRTHVTAPWEGP